MGIKLYLISEHLLPLHRVGDSDFDTYNMIVQSVENNGDLWSDISISPADLVNALKAIDTELGSTRLLPVLAFNNSPHNILGNTPKTPALGYFNPEQARDLDRSFNNLTPDAIDDLENEGPAVADVLYAFQSAADQAAQTNEGIVVVHGR